MLLAAKLSKSQPSPSGELQCDGVRADFQQLLSQRTTLHIPLVTHVRAALPSFLLPDQKPNHCSHYF